MTQDSFIRWLSIQSRLQTQLIRSVFFRRRKQWNQFLKPQITYISTILSTRTALQYSTLLYESVKSINCFWVINSNDLVLEKFLEQKFWMYSRVGKLTEANLLPQNLLAHLKFVTKLLISHLRVFARYEKNIKKKRR